MTSEKLNRAMELDKKREYYELKLGDVGAMQKLVGNLRSNGRVVIGVSIGDAPHVTTYLDISLVEPMLLEADKFYTEKKHDVEDEFARL